MHVNIFSRFEEWPFDDIIRRLFMGIFLSEVRADLYEVRSDIFMLK